jgi:hypothetical protein
VRGTATVPAKNWVIREAYSIFDQMWGTHAYSIGAEVKNGVTASGHPESTDKVTPIFSLSQPAPDPVWNSGTTPRPDFYNHQWIWYYPRNMPMAYMVRSCSRSLT